MKAQILTCSLEDYRRDELGIGQDGPSLNQSVASVLIQESPLHAWAAHPRLGNQRADEPTDEQDRGTLIHKLVLGKGADLEIIQAEDWRTKAAKEARDAARAAGKLPVLERKYAQAAEVAARVTTAVGGLLTGESEVMIAWEEQGGVLCRAQLDHLVLDGTSATIYDLKTCESANPKACAKRVLDQGGDIQAAAYLRAVTALYPDLYPELEELEGRVEFRLIFAEIRPPYAVVVARPGNVLTQLGEARWLRAVETWGRCLREESWPGYGDGVLTLESPPWAVAALEEEVCRDAD